MATWVGALRAMGPVLDFLPSSRVAIHHNSLDTRWVFSSRLIIECLLSTALLPWQGSGWSFSLLPCPAQPAQPPFLQLHKQGGPLPLLTAPEGSV